MVPRSMMMMVALVATPLFRGHASEPVSFNFAPTPEPTVMAWDFTPSAPVVAAKPEPKTSTVNSSDHRGSAASTRCSKRTFRPGTCATRDRSPA